MKLLKINTLLAALSVFFCLFCFTGCGKAAASEAPAAVETTVPATEETAPPETTNPLDLVESLTIVVTEADISQLESYRSLKQLDLTGSTCYAAISRYMKAHPEVEVTYAVSIGEITLPNTVSEITLHSDSFNFDALLENLTYLPKLATIRLPQTSLTMEQINDLLIARPGMLIDYTVSILGEDYDIDTTELDLSAITADQVTEVAAALNMLPNLEYVELMPSGGRSKLDKTDVKVLVDAAPNANFHYTFTLFGKTISTTDETVEYTNVSIGNDGESVIREALDIMTGCTYFKLENCKIDNDVLASIRDDYRDRGIKVVWRIQFGKYSVLTDVETIHAVYNVFDNTCHDLRYCEDVKYMDIGHNGTLTDLSFIGCMPNLEVLIASGCAVKDLSGFENCKKLEWLELVNCSYLKDISPLEGCESLRFLNLSNTLVSDLTPLDDLPLERFVCLNPKVVPANQEAFMAAHEGCWIRFLGSQPYGIGWRYDDNGMTYSEYYLKLREIFDYKDMPLE